MGDSSECSVYESSYGTGHADRLESVKAGLPVEDRFVGQVGGACHLETLRAGDALAETLVVADVADPGGGFHVQAFARGRAQSTLPS